MELISNTAGGFKPPVSDAPDSAWVMQQDLHNLPSPPDTKTLSIISLKWKNVAYQCLLILAGNDPIKPGFMLYTCVETDGKKDNVGKTPDTSRQPTHLR